ncbi:MAG: tyrosine--tRNA ligase, partial [Hadesarchaea archaeon]|nr:tyrosine--tRNA ligase [Hadesarchaea archaeon]
MHAKQRGHTSPTKAFSCPVYFSSGDQTEAEERFKCATQGTSEVVTETELRKLLDKEKITVYCGYEPSGKIHFGHALSVQKLMNFQKLGAHVIVLLADLHAYLNDKGTLEEIRRVAEYNKHCFIALGLDPKRTDFLLGSDFQLKPEFMMDVLRMATGTTLLRAHRSMAEIARHSKDPDV